MEMVERFCYLTLSAITEASFWKESIFRDSGIVAICSSCIAGLNKFRESHLSTKSDKHIKKPLVEQFSCIPG